MDDDERIQWPSMSAFDRVVSSCLYEAENTNIYPWQAIWYLLSILFPDTAARIKPHISCNSTITTILQHKIGSESLQIDLESLLTLLQCLSGQSFFNALEAYEESHSSILRDLFVEARLGIITLVWKEADERALSLLYEALIQLLNTYGDISLNKLCKLLFIPDAAIDATLFADFVLEIGEILSPNMFVIDTGEQLIKIALLRSIFSLTLLLYAAYPPPCLKAIVFSDLFLATYLPYQFISPMHFTLSICNILVDPGALSLSMRTTIGELVLESLVFELTSASSLMSLNSAIVEGCRISTVCCHELLKSVQVLLSSGTPDISPNLEQSIALLAMSALPCMPDYTVSMTHLSAPFVELSILMKDFDSELRAPDGQSRQLFAISMPIELAEESSELLNKHFFASASKNIWTQITLLAACFQIIAGKIRLEPYDEPFTTSLPKLDINILATFLGRLFAGESDTVLSTLINLNSSTFLSSFQTSSHQQEIGNLYYLEMSPRLGRINSIKLWNLLLFNNTDPSCVRQLTLCDNNILMPRGNTVADLLKSVLSSTPAGDEGSLHWYSKWITYLLDVTSMRVQGIPTRALSSEIPIYLIFSFTLSLQYLSYVSAISKMQSNDTIGDAPDDNITYSSFIDYISNTWTLHTNPSISAIILFDTYSCDFHDDGLLAISTLSVLHTIYPVLTRADLQFYNKSGLSFLGTSKSVIEFYRCGAISPLLVTFIVLYTISPDAFPPIHILIGYIMAFSLCPTYESALPFLYSVSPGCLGTCLMNQESQILSLFHDLQTRSSSGNRAVTSSTKQRLWRALDRYIISTHCMTLYVSLLIYISMHELSLLNPDHSTDVKSESEDALAINVKSLLLRHLMSISVAHFTSVMTSKRILLTMEEYAAKSPAIFLELSSSFSGRLNCSTTTMSNLIKSFQNTWTHSLFIKATIDISSFFISLICLDVKQYFSTGNSTQGNFWFIDFPKTVISSVETVTSSGAYLSEDAASDNFTDLFLMVLFMAYNTQSISCLLTDTWINRLAREENTGSDYTSLEQFFAHLYQTQIEQFVLQLFTHISQINMLPPINLSNKQSAESFNQQAEPFIKRQEPPTQILGTPYTANRYLLYIQLADIVISLCTRIAKLYTHKNAWPKDETIYMIAMNIITGVSQTLISANKIITDTYLHQELHSCHPQLQELLFYAQSSLDNSSASIAQMRLFYNTEFTTNLLALDTLFENTVNYMNIYCNAWRLLVCAAWISSSTTKGTDYNHIPALMILHHGGLTIYTYCLLRGLFSVKTRKNKSTLQVTLRSYSQKCTSIRHYLSLLPFYIPGWQPVFTSMLPTLLTTFFVVLRSSIAALHPTYIPSALVDFSGIIQRPDSDVIEALTNTLLTEEDIAGDSTECQRPPE